MSNFIFPPLTLSSWQPTRDTITAYAQVVGKIRRALTPAQKHWWHVSLRAASTGLTTTPVPAGDQTFELLLDFTSHQLLISTSQGEKLAIALNGQSVKAFKDQTLATLAGMGIKPEIDEEPFADDTPGTYDQQAVTNFWQAFSQIDAVFKEFRHGFRGESSPVQLWPHHFDLAVVWFSGNLIPDQDPADPEWADEQMNHGFSTGDGGIPEPYFYITAYPTPAGLTEITLPPGAYWQTDGWTGAVLPYAQIVGTVDGQAQLLDFLRAVHEGGSKLLKSAELSETI